MKGVCSPPRICNGCGCWVQNEFIFVHQGMRCDACRAKVARPNSNKGNDNDKDNEKEIADG